MTITKEEFVERIRVLNKAEREIKDGIRSLQEEYAATSPFEAGEKVRVVPERGAPELAYIQSLYSVSSDGDFNYVLHKVKKDGTPSNFRLHLWGDKYHLEKVTD